ncbi:hypothetical protein N7532_005327 [Penicillium argentinense]|uniref:Fe2OG dioxygenase domain-containing protein n=1 Tax=Penicillium argentinense TaxID=1131581 RepID=A0A9W9KA98_9EURO|nr:uncharacterized protein N7532_005327 [Penicillium argentinense]KAJ5098326.1 hypothetical protein N7532_005327 [Penicillium argentinense]
MTQKLNTENIEDNFPSLPPFPDNVSTAPLLRLSLGKLLAGETAEYERLFQASVDIGFFYLDLQDSEHGNSLLSDADDLFQIGERLFELPLEEKMRYDFSAQNSYFGYKGQGVAVVDKSGNLDRNEFYNVSKDDTLGISDRLPAPDVLHNNREKLRSFINGSHAIVTLILQVLNDKLALPKDTLTNMHRRQAISGDQVRFIKAPPQPIDDRRTALGQHTDFGSVTVLFNRLGGLQVLPPGAEAEWVYVRPLPGHAIINLGDAMVKFTNGLFRSNIHRVAAPPGIQGDSTRYSLVYFARPEDDVMLRRLDGSNLIPPIEDGQVEEEINSKDWIIRRALGRRVDLVKDIDYEKSAGTEQMSRRIKV